MFMRNILLKTTKRARPTASRQDTRATKLDLKSCQDRAHDHMNATAKLIKNVQDLPTKKIDPKPNSVSSQKILVVLC